MNAFGLVTSDASFTHVSAQSGSFSQVGSNTGRVLNVKVAANTQCNNITALINEHGNQVTLPAGSVILGVDVHLDGNLGENVSFHLGHLLDEGKQEQVANAGVRFTGADAITGAVLKECRNIRINCAGARLLGEARSFVPSITFVNSCQGASGLSISFRYI